jgi:hypothetical protein
MSAGCAELAGTPAGVRGAGHRGRVRGAAGSAAGCWPDGRCPPPRGPQPCAGRGTWRPPVADRPCTPIRRRPWAQAAAGGPRRQPNLHPPVVQTRVSAARHAAAADTARVSGGASGTAATWRCRPDGRCWPRGGVQVAADPDAAAVCAVRRRFRHRGRVSMLSGRPLSAADTGARVTGTGRPAVVRRTADTAGTPSRAGG